MRLISSLHFKLYKKKLDSKFILYFNGKKSWNFSGTRLVQNPAYIVGRVNRFAYGSFEVKFMRILFEI